MLTKRNVPGLTNVRHNLQDPYFYMCRIAGAGSVTMPIESPDEVLGNSMALLEQKLAATAF